MPEHPVHQLTTAELDQYKLDLEGSLVGLSEDAPARGDLAGELESVLKEEASRASIARANGAP